MTALDGQSHRHPKKHLAHRQRCAGGCTHERRFNLLKLSEIVDLESVDDTTFSLKMMAAAFEMAIQNVGADQGNIRAAILTICDENIRHGHKLAVASIEVTGGGE